MARRTLHRLMPDPARVVTRMFVAGQEDFGTRESRASKVIERVMLLTEEEVCASLDHVYNRFVDRHDEITRGLEMHAKRIESRMEPGAVVSEERWLLIGALFTHEFSIEGAALTNPSMVPHPDQAGVEEGSLRFIMSVRGIGEGHRSSIGFRTGIVDGTGEVDVDPPGSFPVIGTHHERLLEQNDFIGLLAEMDDMGENARYVLSHLGDSFTVAEMNDVLFRLLDERDSFRNADSTIHHFRQIAERNYKVTFPHERDLSERILWPFAQAEWRGMEDARFVRFTDDDGTVSYLATYTAFDGVEISQQILSTTDFAAFDTRPMSGPAARGKGLAVFPRRIGGMFAAMSRADHESNSVAFSDHLHHWEASLPVQIPRRPWEIIQMGNSGSPIETEAGWLLLTHAVGPMRTYCISATLLDIDDPSRVIGSLDEPILSPREDERDGYVPNVVYSCGAMVHGNDLVIPFGVADQSIGIAVVGMEELLGRLTGE